MKSAISVTAMVYPAEGGGVSPPGAILNLAEKATEVTVEVATTEVVWVVVAVVTTEVVMVVVEGEPEQAAKDTMLSSKTRITTT